MPRVHHLPTRRALPSMLVMLVLLAALVAPARPSLPAQSVPPDRALSHDESLVDRGDTYVAHGTSIRLLRRADRLAVGLTRPDDAAAVDRLTTAGGLLAGFREVRRHDGLVSVLTRTGRTPANAAQAEARLSDTTAAGDAAKADPRVAWVSPVFVDPASGMELVAPDEVIVRLRPGRLPADIRQADRRLRGFRPLLGTSDQFVFQLDGAGTETLDMAARLGGAAGVVWAIPNFYRDLQQGGTTDAPPGVQAPSRTIDTRLDAGRALQTFVTTNDPLLPQQWHLNNTGQNSGIPDADADVVEAWSVNPGGSSDVVIAVLDDGVDLTHPDLALAVNIAEQNGAPGVDDDGNGWVDDVTGWDFTSNGGAGDNDPGPSSADDAHGTAVAGVAAAIGNNGVGVAGVAYRSRILPVRIGLGESFTSDANIASAIYYAAGRTANGQGTWRGSDVMNNSWGGGPPNPVLRDALAWAVQQGRGGKGVVTFISTGNDSPFISNIAYPAAYAGEIEVIAVGASTDQDLRASYSQYGPELDFVAPSNGGSFGIVTTDWRGENGYNAAGDYTDTAGSAFGGTSSATPLAAGIGALLLAQDPNLTARQVRTLMRATTDLIGPLAYDAVGFNLEYGYGRVNAFAAVRGVGVAKVQVLSGNADVPNGGEPIAFGTHPLGRTVERTFVVRNQGTEELILDAASLAVSGPFSIVAPFGDTTLSTGERTTFTVRFTPDAVGSAAGTVAFTSNDASAGTFSFALAGAGVTTSIGGVVFEDWDSDGTRDANDPTVAEQLLYLDTNDNGVLDLGPLVRSSGEINLPILDNRTVVSELTVPQNALITDLNVQVTVNHTHIRDLRMTLISPAGAEIPLFIRRGGDGDNLSGTVFDDEAATAIADGAAPFTGSFRPESSLAAVDDQFTAGTWRLQVEDRSFPDPGTLVNWSLIFAVPSEPITFNDENGFYAFTDVAGGSYSVRRAADSTWNTTGPAGGAYAVTLATGGSVLGRDFGVARRNAIYGQVFNDRNRSGARDAGEPGLASRQVYLDVDGNRILTPGALTRGSGTLDLAIPDDNLSGVETSLSVVNPVQITDLNVQITLTHEYMSDLEIELTSPRGTVVRLFTMRGGEGDNLTGTLFDDEAAAGIDAGTAPFTGSFRPESPLAAFDGEPLSGDWKLRLRDTSTPDLGSLVSWSLIFTTVERNVVTAADGSYRITDLPAATYSVRQIGQARWLQTLPAADGYTLPLAAGASLHNNDFGNFTETNPPTATLGPVTPSSRTTPVARLTISFNEPVTGLDLADMVLTRDGASVALSGATLSGSGASYTLNGLAGLNAAPGTYTLTVRAAESGIIDAFGNTLATDAGVTWVRTAATVFIPLVAR